MVEKSTIFNLRCFTNAMRNETKTYDRPFIGCLVGSAFQKLICELEISLKKAGMPITAPEYMVLRALYSSDGLQQCEIADMVGKDKASVSRCVVNLARKDLVKQEQVSHKCCRVWLTERAQEIRPTIMEIAEERHRELSSLASQTDIETFVSVLKQIVNN